MRIPQRGFYRDLAKSFSAILRASEENAAGYFCPKMRGAAMFAKEVLCVNKLGDCAGER
jgi:hypothetical protein